MSGLVLFFYVCLLPCQRKSPKETYKYDTSIIHCWYGIYRIKKIGYKLGVGVIFKDESFPFCFSNCFLCVTYFRGLHTAYEASYD